MTPKQDYQIRMSLESEICEHLSKAWDAKHIKTKQSKYCAVDCLFVKDSKFVAICEIRTRRDSWEDVKRWGGLLMNQIKLNNAVELSRQFGVPFLFVAYFIKDNLLMYWKVTDENGKYCIEMQLTSKEAQKNIASGNNVKMIRNVILLPNNPILLKNPVFNPKKRLNC